jgi:FMN phosphatase YigB (HAD superfamily)
MSQLDREKVILTDCDGVLLNWEYAFKVWMKRHGYEEGSVLEYDVAKRYGLEPQFKRHMIRMFNESAAIGFLPPLRDAMHYVKKLHEEHGYVFHMVTSLSLDPAAQSLRIENTRKLFGETAFERFVFLDTGADKDEALAEYKDSNYVWVEDKPENARLGIELGLDSVLVEHGHNMNEVGIPLFKNWKEIYEYVVGV